MMGPNKGPITAIYNSPGRVVVPSVLKTRIAIKLQTTPRKSHSKIAYKIMTHLYIACFGSSLGPPGALGLAWALIGALAS